MSSCRGRIGCGVALVFIAALGAAAELYDEVAPADMEPDFAYQEVNELDTGPERLEEFRLPPVNDPVLYKLVHALEAQKLAARYRSNWLKSRNSLDASHSATNIKESVFKRLPTLVSTEGADKLPQPVIRPQRKWKIKKGKAVGSQMVCYFKLCAFRSPS